jgi:hypothetical protein
VFQGGATLDSSLIEINTSTIAGVVEISNCTFIDCAFLNISFIAERAALDSIRAMFKKPE